MVSTLGVALSRALRARAATRTGPWVATAEPAVELTPAVFALDVRALPPAPAVPPEAKARTRGPPRRVRAAVVNECGALTNAMARVQQQ